MPTHTLIAYGLTLVAVVLPITAFAQLLTGVLFGRNIGVLVSALLGSLAVWFLIDFLWRRFEGAQVSMAVLGASLLIIGIKSLVASYGRDPRYRGALAAEALAIALLAAWLYFWEPNLRLT